MRTENEPGPRRPLLRRCKLVVRIAGLARMGAVTPIRRQDRVTDPGERQDAPPMGQVGRGVDERKLIDDAVLRPWLSTTMLPGA